MQPLNWIAWHLLAYATPRRGKECYCGVPEIQEGLSLNQAQTRNWRVADSQKTVEISEITEMFARGIWIAFMSTGGSFTNEWHELQSRCDRNGE